MKSRFLAIVLMLVLLTSAALPGAAQDNPSAPADVAPAARLRTANTSSAVEAPFSKQTQFIVRGRVLDTAGQPQTGLRVEALYPGRQTAGYARTGSSGQFTLSGLEPGAYRLRVLDSGGNELSLVDTPAAGVSDQELRRPRFHELVLMNSASPAETNQPGEALPPQEAPNLSPFDSVNVIQGTGQITGVVTGEDSGLPLDSVYVSVNEPDGDWVANAYTDFDGQYTISGLDTGNYLVNFIAYSANYIREWYDGKLSFDQADPVHVEDGAVTPNINASLQPGGEITGTVTASDTLLPLDSVYVQVNDQDGHYITYAYTDGDGNYVANKLPTGDFYVAFYPYSTPDYLPEYYNDKPDLASADPVHVTQGNVTGGIDAVLARGARITGQVTGDDTGLPLQDIQVEIRTSDGDYFGYTNVAADGTYTVTGLVTGSYLLRFIPDTNGSSQDYITEFYNDKGSLETADPIAVVAPDTVSGIDVSLARGGKITGQVTADDTGLPLTEIYVQATSAEGDIYKSTFVDANGIYTVTGLISGSYRLYFEPNSSSPSADYVAEYYNNKYTFETADLVDVTAPDAISGVDISLLRGGKITGQVTAEVSGDPIGDVYVTLYTQEGDYQGNQYTSPSGVYTFTALLSGGYTLHFNPSYASGYEDFIPEYYNDKPEMDLADIVDVTAPDTTSGIDAALAEGGKITGVVTAAETSLPLDNVAVYAYDGDGDKVASTSTNASGHYTLTQLTSSAFFVYYDPSYSNPDYMPEYYDGKADLESADPVAVVAPNATGGIDASLERGGSIIGRVTGADSGLGLPEVGISIIDCYGWYVDGATTDASGYYTVTGLIPGGYSVRFTPWDDGQSMAYLEEYYDNKATLEESTIVTVASEEILSGIDAELTRGGQINGRVTAADGGLPLDDIDITIYSSAGWYMDDTLTDQNGVYTTTGLASGDYFVYFYSNEYSNSREYIKEYYDDQATYGDADPVHVNMPDVHSGVDAVLERGGKISGRITAEGSGAGIEDVWVDVYNQAVEYWAYSSADAGGYYTVYGLPSGDYEVSFDPYGDDEMYIRENYNNKPQQQSPDLVPVTAPAETSNINAQLALGGSIPCLVKAEGTGEPLDDVYVAAYNSQGDWVADDWTNQDGECLLTGLPTGSYRVWFETTISYSYEACIISRVQYVGEYYNNKPDLESADPINVTAPGMTNTIEALLALGAPLPPVGPGTVFLPMVSR